VLAAVALLVALVFLPHDARAVWQDVRNGHATPHAQRELGPAYSVGILDPQAIVAAKAYIEPGQTYAVIAGPNAPQRTADAQSYVLPWAELNLLPRRATPRADEAQWILSYGGDLTATGLHFRRVIRLAQGVELAEVKR
jgi:hypothetical protein